MKSSDVKTLWIAIMFFATLIGVGIILNRPHEDISCGNPQGHERWEIPGC